MSCNLPFSHQADTLLHQWRQSVDNAGGQALPDGPGEHGRRMFLKWSV